MKTLLLALSQWGVKGTTGIIHNPEVMKYFKETGHSWVKDDETAWCAAFINWCLIKSGFNQTGSLAARSFLTYGNGVLKPALGDIVVLWRISPTSPYGHVGLYITEDKENVYILGGNQTNAVNCRAFPKTQVITYRRIPNQ